MFNTDYQSNYDERLSLLGLSCHGDRDAIDDATTIFPDIPRAEVRRTSPILSSYIIKSSIIEK
jgi:hypothetical protein